MRFDGEKRQAGGIEFLLLTGTSHLVPVIGSPVVRVPILSTDPAELTCETARTDVIERMAESVTRRGLHPRGRWIIGHTPVDWPDWRTDIHPQIAAQVGRKLVEINGHVMVYYLFDSAELIFG